MLHHYFNHTHLMSNFCQKTKAAKSEPPAAEETPVTMQSDTSTQS